MGSFSVACGMSNLPIHMGDDMGIVLLSKNPFGNNHPTSSTIYDSSVYFPFFAPIYGEYGDYGMMENIVADDNTATLEKFFGLPIQEIVNSVAMGCSFYGKTPISKALFQADKDVLDGGYSLGDILIKTGFTQSVDGRFTFQDYLVEIVSNYGKLKSDLEDDEVRCVVSNTTNGKSVGEIRRVKGGLEFLSEFAELTKVYPGYDPASFGRLALLSELAGMFFLKEIFDGMKEEMPKQEYLNDFHVNEWHELQKAKADQANFNPESVKENRDFDAFRSNFRLTFAIASNRAQMYIDRATAFPIEEIDFLVENATDAFWDIQAVNVIMRSTNHPLTPTFCGEQDGNVPASIKLAKLTMKIAKKKLKEYGFDD